LIFKGISETPVPGFHKQRTDQTTGDIGYNPSLGLVPQLTLPDNLPELGNFATFDVNTANDWTKEQMTSIVPSYANAMLPDINDLSFITNTTSPVEPEKTTASPVEPENTTTLPVVPQKPTPPLPPPDNQHAAGSGGGNSLFNEIRNFSNRTLRPISNQNRRDQAPSTTSQGEESTMARLKKELERRRAFITGDGEQHQSDDSDDDDDK